MSSYKYLDKEIKFKTNLIKNIYRSKTLEITAIQDEKVIAICVLTIVSKPLEKNHQSLDNNFLKLCVNYQEEYNRKQGNHCILIARSIDRVARSTLRNILYDQETTISLHIHAYWNSDIDKKWMAISFLNEAIKCVYDISCCVISASIDKITKTVCLYEESPKTNQYILFHTVNKEVTAFEFYGNLPTRDLQEIIKYLHKKLDHKTIKKIKLWSYEKQRRELNIKYFKTSTRMNERKLLETRKLTILSDSNPYHLILSRGDTIVMSKIQSNSTNHINHQYLSYGASCGELYSKRSRRIMGHGMLVQNAFKNIELIGKKDGYSLKSHVLQSNGSTSMCSLMASSANLFRYGLIDKKVYGISMGLLRNGRSTKIIYDMTADEDDMSDMDLKIGGTISNNISCIIKTIQMDTKRPVSLSTIIKCLEQTLPVFQNFQEQLKNQKKEAFIFQINKDVIQRFRKEILPLLRICTNTKYYIKSGSLYLRYHGDDTNKAYTLLKVFCDQKEKEMLKFFIDILILFS